MTQPSGAAPAGPAADLSLELTRFAVDAAGEAMFTIAPSGHILDANKTACKRLEYSREELVSMTVGDVDPNYASQDWDQHFEQLRHEGEMTFETQHRSKSGRVFDVEVSVAYFEFEGNEYCCSTVRNITDRKQAEQLRQLQHDILAQIASTSGLLTETLNALCGLVEKMVPNSIATIMAMDPKDGCLRFDAGPSLTREIREAFEPLQPGEAAGSCGSAAYFKKPIIVEDTRQSDHWKPLQHIVNEFQLYACWSLPLMDERGQVLGTFAISHPTVGKPTDYQFQILETATHLASIAIRRQRFEEQLHVAQEELAHIHRVNTMGEMASSLAHELNQPLTAIVNRAFLLELQTSEQTGLEAIRENIDIIRDQSLRAGEIVASVRDMVRGGSPTRRTVPLNELVRKSLKILEPELRQMGVALHRELNDNIRDVNVDEVQIQQVLVNLVRNASDAMQEITREERLLTVSTESDDANHVVLSVTDSGPGLAEDVEQSLFEPFQTTKRNGMGMGLAICRSIAENHSGQLTARNGNGQGAVFSLSLPIKSDCQP